MDHQEKMAHQELRDQLEYQDLKESLAHQERYATLSYSAYLTILGEDDHLFISSPTEL